MTIAEKTQICDGCEKAKVTPHFGWYVMSCVSCCARLVMTTPDQDRVISAYTIFRGRNHAPSAEQIQQEVERLQAMKAVG